MTTAADRLVAIAGHGGTASALLLAIGIGATAGAALVDYSGLSTATATQHLLAETQQVKPTGERIIWENLKRIPVQVVTARGESVEWEVVNTSATVVTLGVGSVLEMTADRAAGVQVNSSSVRGNEGGSARASAAVTVDRARLARLDDDLMWL